MRTALVAVLLLAAGQSFAQPQPESPSGWQSRDAAHAKRFMVAAANPLAVDAGVEARILRCYSCPGNQRVASNVTEEEYGRGML